MSAPVKFLCETEAVKGHGFTLRPVGNPKAAEYIQWEWLLRPFDLVSLSGAPLTAQLMLEIAKSEALYPESGSVEDLDKNAILELATSAVFVANA